MSYGVSLHVPNFFLGTFLFSISIRPALMNFQLSSMEWYLGFLAKKAFKERLKNRVYCEFEDTDNRYT